MEEDACSSIYKKKNTEVSLIIGCSYDIVNVLYNCITEVSLILGYSYGIVNVLYKYKLEAQDSLLLAAIEWRRLPASSSELSAGA